MNVRELRQRKLLSQRELAEKAGVSETTIVKLETGTTKPQPRRKSIIKQGISAFTIASKKHRALSLSTPPVPRVLDYQRTFGPLVNNDVMQ